MKNELLDAIVIGTGFAGLCAAIKLKEEKMSFVVLEKDNGVGGVWKVNTYPGAQCDVQSHLYSFSFDQNPNWSRSYGLQNEIQTYLKKSSEKYGVTPHILFNTEVTSSKWNEEENYWEVEVKSGKVFYAKTVFFGIGGLSQIAMPDIKGLKSFKGKLFHSARWDHSTVIKNKKVAIIGSAASAIQIIPAIAKDVKKLTVLQRSASWIIPKNDRLYSELEKLSFNLFPPLLWLSREITYWMLEWRAMAFVYSPQMLNNFQKLIENYIKMKVKDPELAKKVTPNYKIGCKRILLSDNYYETIQRPNVEIETNQIKEINETGILLNNGTHIEADIIITATGFKAADDVVPFDVIGKNGVSLEKEWEEGAQAFLGTTIKGFPNLFMIVGPNTGLGHNSMVYMIEAQTNYSIKALRFIKKNKISSLEVKPEIQKKYNDSLQEKLEKSIWNTGGCASWYLNKNGRNTTLWPGFTFEFKKLTEKFNINDYSIQKSKNTVSK
ncbi:MAG: NAD(P)/FAD-dependent oxidoreductase [Leptospiraceae bacterium]|nr:NAD(P)/FAD-dependent oxidoreductase [Leptospiraceae bacterium]